MRKTIYLIRHAESQKNVNPLSDTLDNGLTETGTKQAQELARRMQSKTIEHIYVSDSERAKQTAKEIGEKMHIDPIELEYIYERKCVYQNEKEFTYTEDFEDLKKRLDQTKAFLEDSISMRTVVVSHAGFIKALALYLTLGELFSEALLDKVEPSLILDNTGIVKLVYNVDKRKWSIDTWNDKSHLRY